MPKTVAISIRLEKQLLSLLDEGARRTPLNKRELLRRTLRLHLRDVIEAEAVMPSTRITTVNPWPRGVLAKAYKRADKEWDKLEVTATAAQGKPSWND